MMHISTESGLAIARLTLTYQNKSLLLKNVLLDTGCVMTIFDTDVVEKIGLVPDRKKGRLVFMIGIGGRSDCCVEQVTPSLTFDEVTLYGFRHQIGSIYHRYGFEAILGNDFLTASGLVNWDTHSLTDSETSIAQYSSLIH
ncbi:aspartyl protease family protein [Pullulanibacillus sp. KACC 23026]|uniref:aspartyl protease family protein n=1 Tax=Pullulanibacillus sp. KACC 23026 TaxID=3028315 RepID=UPI0023AFA286|nr:aspartyl protease family protein [Pullulanibacillus sp. KACC 23026]WEG10837.1 aspartyl protease family protein [Pullulanibacillus sp. KACC 23026]